MSESLSLEELQELERLLLMMEHWDKLANPPMPALQPPAPMETNEKSEKRSKPKPLPIEPQRDFIDRICGPGSDKPSGKMLGKWDWMG